MRKHHFTEKKLIPGTSETIVREIIKAFESISANIIIKHTLECSPQIPGSDYKRFRSAI